MRGRRKNKKYPIAAVIVAVIAVLCYIFISGSDSGEPGPVMQPTDYPLCVSFIDVGQGDCELISCEGKNILVDGGEAKSAQTVLTYLDTVNVDKIDCYILTHPHADHIGAAAKIIESVEISEVYMTYFSEFNIPTTKTYENTLIAIENSGATPIAVEAGDSFTFGELKIDVISPAVETDDYNDMSIVFTASYKDSVFLFTGDATADIERQLSERGENVSADVLKVGHHGSKTSSSAEFINAVSPKYSVISCGKGNSYGHPHDVITERLQKTGTKILRTDISGNILIYGDGKNLYTKTER